MSKPCPGPARDDDFLNSGNCEISTVSTTTSPGNNDVLNENNGEVSTVSSTTAPGTCKPAQQGHNVDHIINVLQLESLKVKRTMGLCICATTVMTTSSCLHTDSNEEAARPANRDIDHQETQCNCGVFMVFRTRKTMGAGLSTMTGMSTTIDERQLRHKQNLSCTTTGM